MIQLFDKEHILLLNIFVIRLSYCDSGAKHLFVHKGILIAKPSQEMKITEDECIEHAINAGAEEVETEDENLEPGYFKVFILFDLML